MLVPALEQNTVIEVILDGAEGYGSSFLEEAFGGLVRAHSYSKEFLDSHLKIISNSDEYDIYRNIAYEYIRDALELKS